ncbi:hypothetical protein JTB14_016350 [Gonioctena quinquepunctata]|nr:hypothetical protein JTB14_016350 [Gonioctena quinquepunctata]
MVKSEYRCTMFCQRQHEEKFLFSSILPQKEYQSDDCMVAFNFASIEEARDLRIVVHQKVQARKRREEKRSRQISQSQTLPPPTTHTQFRGHKTTLDPAEKQSKRKRNITKADIGIPRDFKHISHVGWNSTSGFDIDTEDEQLRAFFKKVSKYLCIEFMI